MNINTPYCSCHYFKSYVIDRMFIFFMIMLLTGRQNSSKAGFTKFVYWNRTFSTVKRNKFNPSE